MTLEFRALRAEEVECRVAQCSEKGLSLLLYKTARVDMDLLDEVVGAENWQKDYKTVDGKLFCGIAVKCDGEWIWKWDVGTPSNMEAEKGQVSDAMKRAGFCWNIGRELYTAPFIWVPADKCNIRKGRNGKDQCYDRFDVTEMEVSDGAIVKLTIVNRSKNNIVVYGGGSVPYTQAPVQAPAQEPGEAPQGDYTATLKRRMWEAIKRWSALHNRDPHEVLEGVRKRPNWADSAEFYEATALDFENDMNG